MVAANAATKCSSQHKTFNIEKKNNHDFYLYIYFIQNITFKEKILYNIFIPVHTYLSKLFITLAFKYMKVFIFNRVNKKNKMLFSLKY